MLFQKVVSDQLLLAAVMVGQIAILVYDKAYQYVQGTLWGKNGENVFYKECMRKSCRDDRISLNKRK